MVTVFVLVEVAEGTVLYEVEVIVVVVDDGWKIVDIVVFVWHVWMV